MAHYAKIINGSVVDVIVAEQDVIDSGLFGEPSTWVQTSYNTRGGVHYVPDDTMQFPSEDQSKALRKNYASMGGYYDADADAFYDIQPYTSWILNKNTYLWEAPVNAPLTHFNISLWDEDNVRWVMNNKETKIKQYWDSVNLVWKDV